MVEMMRLGFADARAFVYATHFCLEKCTNAEGTEAGRQEGVGGVEMNIKSNEFLSDAQERILSNIGQRGCSTQTRQ